MLYLTNTKEKSKSVGSLNNLYVNNLISFGSTAVFSILNLIIVESFLKRKELERNVEVIENLLKL